MRVHNIRVRYVYMNGAVSTHASECPMPCVADRKHGCFNDFVFTFLCVNKYVIK